jgi:dTDP-4-dehydrorhamnose 3,5-epimerase
MKVIDEPLEQLKLIELPYFCDHRGSFTKSFHAAQFHSLGIDFVAQEEFCSVSRRGVIRGMHFQLPPDDHAKLVFCPHGQILDVAVDLRKASPTYGEHFATELGEENHRAIFIPPGFAHGFLSLEDRSLVFYSVSSIHSPTNDRGIRWDSFGMDWRTTAPIISDRDLQHPPLREFSSPF